MLRIIRCSAATVCGGTRHEKHATPFIAAILTPPIQLYLDFGNSIIIQRGKPEFRSQRSAVQVANCGLLCLSLQTATATSAGRMLGLPTCTGKVDANSIFCWRVPILANSESTFASAVLVCVTSLCLLLLVGNTDAGRQTAPALFACITCRHASERRTIHAPLWQLVFVHHGSLGAACNNLMLWLSPAGRSRSRRAACCVCMRPRC